MRRKADQLIPLEIAILEAGIWLLKQGTNAFHGYSLAKVIKSETNGRMLTAYGTLYRALHRLERAGFVEGFWEDPALAESESRPRRKLYRLTALSHLALARERERSRGKLGSLREGMATE